MDFLAFFREVPRLLWIKFLLLAAISGCSNAAVLMLVNRAITVKNDEVRTVGFLAFVLAIVLFRVVHSALILGATRLTESMVHKMRITLLEQIQSIDLRSAERLSRDSIYVCISTEMDKIAAAAFTFSILIEQGLVTLITLSYLAYLSLIGLVSALCFVVFATFIHIMHNNQINIGHQNAFMLQSKLLERCKDLLEGFKEAKLNYNRSIDIVDAARVISNSVLEKKMMLNGIFCSNHVNSQTSYFVFIGAIVFGAPLIIGYDNSLIMSAVGALFLIGPVFSIINSIPSLQKLNGAIKSILSVKSTLVANERFEGTQPTRDSQFAMISLRGVTFTYENSPVEFCFGPINLDIKKGEIWFVTGGNGSGKSTLLKILTGLYFPSEGTLTIDQTPVIRSNIIEYRRNFSAVFSDNYLSKTLYGIPELNSVELDVLFDMMEIRQKTYIAGRSFNDIDLSTGQRKRLALIAAILEHRPILVLDEWAADQDVHFRQKFYSVIVPWLRSSGRTVIAVTHDEKYFNAADFRLNLDNGVICRLSYPA